MTTDRHDTREPSPPGPTAGGSGAGRRPAPGRRGKGYLLPGVIALAALLGLGVVFVGAGDLQHPAATHLTGPDLASQIALAIQAQENAARTPSVTCPDREPVRQGLRFDCTLAGPPPRTVYVTEVDGRGRIRWSFQRG